MAFGQELADLYQRQSFWVHSTPAIYTNAAHNIFAITGGMVLIEQIIEYCDTAMNGATQSRIAVGAVTMDGAAVAIDAGGQFAIVVSPLDAAVNKIASALAVQAPSLLGFATNQGVIAGPGVNITATFSVVAMTTTDLYSLHVKYRKIHPQALIS